MLRYPTTEFSTAEDLALQEVARDLLAETCLKSRASKREAFKQAARAAFADRIPQMPHFEAIIDTTFERAADAYYTPELVAGALTNERDKVAIAEVLAHKRGCDLHKFDNPDPFNPNELRRYTLRRSLDGRERHFTTIEKVLAELKWVRS